MVHVQRRPATADTDALRQSTELAPVDSRSCHEWCHECGACCCYRPLSWPLANRGADPLPQCDELQHRASGWWVTSWRGCIRHAAVRAPGMAASTPRTPAPPAVVSSCTEVCMDSGRPRPGSDRRPGRAAGTSRSGTSRSGTSRSGTSRSGTPRCSHRGTTRSASLSTSRERDAIRLVIEQMEAMAPRLP
jgi:hypothetical protein